MARDTIPPIGLGTFQNTDPDECETAVRTALDVGYRHVDTAEYYENEEAVGKGIAASSVPREEMFLATKVFREHNAHDEVLEHARGCLDRLGVESVDLFYVHWPLGDYDHEGTLAAFDQLYDEGLIRNVGLSNFRVDQLDEALDHLDVPLFAHQVEMHPMLPQRELVAYAQEHDHYLVAYSPIAKGDVASVPELQAVAEKHDATPHQVSLAWLIDQENVVAIPKATSEAHIRENLGALDIDLDDEDRERIDSIDRQERKVDFPAAPWNQV
jgi:2,5-diketo-D-gluconate reductase B